MGHNSKRDSHNIRGDTIEIRLRDITYEVYHKDLAHIDNKKEMDNLIRKLKDKGVTFPTSWFE